MTVLEDLAALAGLAVAAIGVTLSHLLDAPRFDAAAPIVIGVILMFRRGSPRRGDPGPHHRRGRQAHPHRPNPRGRGAACGDRRGRRHPNPTLGRDAVLLLLGVRPPRELAVSELEAASQTLTSELRDLSSTIKHVAFYAD